MGIALPLHIGSAACARQVTIAVLFADAGVFRVLSGSGSFWGAACEAQGVLQASCNILR